MLRVMLKTQIIILICLTAALSPSGAMAQSILDEASISSGDYGAGGTFTETIQIISRSGKIFILSNGNQMLNKGDFITLILKGKGPLARSVVAKTHEGKAGIKVLKVYSLARWNQIRKGMNVEIIKGDDSALFKKSSGAEVAIEGEPDARINNEEDLFNDKLINEDLSDFYKDNRLIKPDNIVSVGWDQYIYTKTDNGEGAGNQFNFAWAYQFSDNYWVEGLFGRTQIDDFPRTSTQTVVANFTGRLKYTFKAPFYSYLMPYIGFQTYSVSSPEAGQADTDEESDIELSLVNDMETSDIVLGVTFLRRLVPGWFFKLDVGTDITSIGVAIEF